MLDPGSWIQDPGSRILDQDLGSRILDPGPRILDRGSWIQGSNSRHSNFVYFLGKVLPQASKLPQASDFFKNTSPF